MEYSICVVAFAGVLILVSSNAAPECNFIEKLYKTELGCKYNPDVYLTVPQIIRRHGYPSESHVIETEDGYLLTAHRIPGSKNGRRGSQPILLQHGLLSSSSDWVVEDNDSLAFMLADAGYDVWLGNSRGNTYSRGHVSLPVDSNQFWNFSFHEMGMYDLPAVVYYINNVTNKAGELLYVGHSMGTTQFFIFSSMKPAVAKHVKAMVALAPVAYMAHVSSPIRYLTPWVDDFEWIAKHLGINQFLPNSKIMSFLALECLSIKLDKRICENIIFLLLGFNKKEFEMNILPVLAVHDPAGSSTKTLLHYAQEVKDSGNFQQFDYGAKGNMIRYGTLTPPQYKVENIKVPIYLMYGPGDVLAAPEDVIHLSQTLKNKIGLYRVPMESFNHVDFLFGKDAPNFVYKPLMKVLKNFTEEDILIQLI